MKGERIKMMSFYFLSFELYQSLFFVDTEPLVQLRISWRASYIYSKTIARGVGLA